MQDRDSMNKVELGGFRSIERPRSRQRKPWERVTDKFSAQRGRQQDRTAKAREARQGREERDDTTKLKSLMFKTAVCAVVALALVVLKSIDSPMTQGVVAGVQSASSQANLDDIGRLKFVEEDAITQSVMNSGVVTEFIFPVEGKITAKFGENGSTGLSIQAKQGGKVLSAVNGTVFSIEDDKAGGKVVTIKNFDNSEASYYGVKPSVEKGAAVNSGSEIGTLAGDTLRLELYQEGKAVDPLNYINKRGL